MPSAMLIKSFLTLSLIVFIGMSTIGVALAEQQVKISPWCGPHDLNIMIKAKGFLPNSNVAWKLVNESGYAPLTGYYQTNSEGEIKDTTTIDDVSEGIYRLYFGDDVNTDGDFDFSDKVTYANLEMPCPK